MVKLFECIGHCCGAEIDDAVATFYRELHIVCPFVDCGVGKCLFGAGRPQHRRDQQVSLECC